MVLINKDLDLGVRIGTSQAVCTPSCKQEPQAVAWGWRVLAGGKPGCDAAVKLTGKADCPWSLLSGPGSQAEC